MKHCTYYNKTPLGFVCMLTDHESRGSEKDMRDVCAACDKPLKIQTKLDELRRRSELLDFAIGALERELGE